MCKMKTTLPKCFGALKASAPNSHDDVPGPPCAACAYGYFCAFNMFYIEPKFMFNATSDLKKY